MKSTPPEEGIGIAYDPEQEILELTVFRDDGKPEYVILKREDALLFVQRILYLMGIGSELLELGVPPKEEQN